MDFKALAKKCTFNSLTLVLLVVLATLGTSTRAGEPLRILIPIFSGSPTAAKGISMTMYFEMVKAFQGHSRSRGAWVLYGHEQMSGGTHRIASAAATWPSVSADIAIWGRISRVDGQYVVEPFVTLTPISRTRALQPDVLEGQFRANGKDYRLQRRNSGRFFDLEPFTVTEKVQRSLAAFENGVPVYHSEGSQEPTAHWDGVLLFTEINESSAKVRFGVGRNGWVRFPKFAHDSLSIVTFGQGLIQILGGDWKGAIKNFRELVKSENLPNALRIHSLIYIGIAKYKLGMSGLSEFRAARSLNVLDKNAAAFQILGLLLDYKTSQKRRFLIEAVQLLNESYTLFGKNDKWISEVQLVTSKLMK